MPAHFHFGESPPFFELPDNQNEGNPSIEFNSLTSVNINTSPDEKDRCNLQVIISNEKGKPVKGASVVLKKPKLGKLSALSVVTDAGGQARVVYTAPTDEELEKLGKEEIDVLLEATDVKAGKSSSIEIHVKSKNKKFATRIKHEILPSHPDYYNQIDFAFKAANKPDGSPYKAVITVKNSNGALVKNRGDQGGTRKLEMKVWPKNKYTFYYHWIGSTAMTKPFDEVVNIEISELKLKKTVKFSVGIDLAIDNIERQGGKVFPGILDPFNIYISDKFHPKVDLGKLLEEFSLKGISIDLEQTEYKPSSFTADLAQNSLLSAFMARVDGWSNNPRHKAIIYNPGKWRVKKAKNGRYILFSTGKDLNGNLGVHYPSVIYRARGSYKFKASIKPDLSFDAIGKNNTINSKVYEVKYFRYFADDAIHTVLLPSYQFALEAYIGIKGAMAANITLAGKNVLKDLYLKNYKSLFVDAFGAVASASETLDFARKNIVDSYTLASYVCTLSTKAEDVVSWWNGTTKTRSKSPKKIQDKKIQQLFEIEQLAVKGFKNQYVIIVEKQGINTYSASLKNGVKLEHIPQKIYKASKLSQKIDESEKYIVISANKREKINLNLNGSGAQGEIYIITPDKIKSYKYPNRNWHSVIEVDNSGSAIVKEGSELVKESTSINNNVNEKTKNHNPAQNEINNTSPSIGITGTWRSNFGNITFHQQGNTVTGTYTHDHGRLVGFLRGNILTGKWYEAPTYKPDHDAGAFELIFSPDRNSFTGHWRYGFKGNSWDGKWDGTFINDR